MRFASFILLCSLQVQVFATEAAEEDKYGPYPARYDELVNVFGELSEQEKIERDELRQRVDEFRRRTFHLFTVVIVDSIHDYPGTANNSIEDFANGLFERYDLRFDPPSVDNNLLLLISRQDRRSFLKVGTDYIDATQQEILQLNREHIQPMVEQGRVFRAAINNIPRIRKTLFGWAYEPRGFPWEDVFIGVGIVALIVALVAAIRYSLRLSWLMSLALLSTGVFLLVGLLFTKNERYIYENRHNRAFSTIISDLIEIYRSRSPRRSTEKGAGEKSDAAN